MAPVIDDDGIARPWVQGQLTRVDTGSGSSPGRGAVNNRQLYRLGVEMMKRGIDKHHGIEATIIRFRTFGSAHKEHLLLGSYHVHPFLQE